MNGKCHLSLGLAAGAALAVTMPEAALPLFVSSAVGELYPDIDLETSMLGHVVKPISHALNKAFGHRGFIHTPVCAALSGTLLYMLLYCVFHYDKSAYAAAAFFIGYCLHLLQDMLTKGGIRLFWPIPWRIHLTRMRADSAWCYVLTILLCGLVIYAAFARPDIPAAAVSAIASVLQSIPLKQVVLV